MAVTLSGINMEVRLMQFSNALAPIVFIPGEIVILFTWIQFLNAPCAISTTGMPPYSCSILGFGSRPVYRLMMMPCSVFK